MQVFGPVPSRRLGQSIGINNIPPKACSYSCIYCQLGRTNNMQIKRARFYKPKDLLKALEDKFNNLKPSERKVDYITFVADGEPTLDINLGKEIAMMKAFGVPVAVITNASLLWRDDVKHDLMNADWVSVKVDAVDEKIWKKINRPHGALVPDDILKGIRDFASDFAHTLVTETMLVKGVNDHDGCIEAVAGVLYEIRPSTAYIMVPTRPPAEQRAVRPGHARVRAARDVIRRQAGVFTECITGDEGDDFFGGEDVVEDLLGIMSVHPMRETALIHVLKSRNYGMEIVDRLVEEGKVEAYMHEGSRFYRRKF